MTRRLASSLAVFVLVGCGRSIVPPAAAGSISSGKPVQRPIAKPPKTNPTTEVGALLGMTEQHNTLRATVGVPALEWSNELGAYAQTWATQIAANNCQLAHRTGDNYGENLYWGSGGTKTPAQVAAVWSAEKGSYDHASNSCARGQICGHYTQMIWTSTRYVGCGRATCNNGEVWVCNYDPPGNFDGQAPY